MKIKTVDLYEEFGLTKKEGQEGTLICWTHFQSPEINENRLRPAMLVIGGGGYHYVSNREREPVALEYFAQGYNVFDLKYSVRPFSYPTQLLEACMAMAYIRKHADAFGVIENKVAAVGFSAGGHLLGTLSTLYGEPEVKKVVGDINVRPDASVFSYAVVTCEERTHMGTMETVTGGDEKLKEKLSIEKRVDKNSPPAFIWCTADDGCVPCENSLMLAAAYKKAGVPFELHVFESGVHGLSVCNVESGRKDSDRLINEPVSKWLPLSFTWLKNRGFLIKD